MHQKLCYGGIYLPGNGLPVRNVPSKDGIRSRKLMIGRVRGEEAYLIGLSKENR